MFYVNVPVSKGITLEVEIHSDNVFTKCHVCGEEIQVDLADLFSDGEGDLDHTNIVCEDCVAKYLKGNGHP